MDKDMEANAWEFCCDFVRSHGAEGERHRQIWMKMDKVDI